MQKFLLTFSVIAATAAAGYGQAARPSTSSDRFIPLNGKHQGPQIETVNDTLLPTGFQIPCGDTVTIYTPDQEWGYVSGTNGYLDKEKAQRFAFPNFAGATVVEAWIFFGEKGGPGAAQLTAKVYNAASPTAGPAALLGVSAPLTAAQVQVDPALALPTIFTFPAPAALTSANFFVSADISNAYQTGDTLGILTTREGCGSGAWERFSDDNWFSFADGTSSWGLTLSLYILPVLQRPAASISETLRGQTAIAFESGRVVLMREGASASRARMRLYTAQGQMIADWQAQPGDRTEFDAAQLAPGVYVWVVETAQGAFGLKFKY